MLSATHSIASRAPLAVKPRRQPAAARRPVQTQAFFGFLAPPKPKAGPSKAQELVDQLLELSERTDGGINASPAKRQQIAELVEELEAYCPRNPLRSPLLFGDFEVLYASKPQTAGGPFRSPLGRTIFPGQRALQSIQEPNICINEVTYKTLGFIPGSARQNGEISAISGDTFQLVFPELDGKAKGGPPQRIIQIAYLDERIRVARAIPPEDREDQEGSFYVFRRLVEEEEVEEEEEAPAPPPKRAPFGGTRKLKAQIEVEEEEEAPAPRRGGLLGTQLLGGRKEGLATRAERRYAQQQGSRGTGTQGKAAAGTQGKKAAAGTQASGSQKKTREEIAAERAAAKAAAEEERRAAREAAAAAKAAAEEERRARQAQLEAERARVAELKERAREQLAQLQSEAGEAADAAKEAAVTAKEAEKAAADLLKQASVARMAIDQAAGAAAAAVEQVLGLQAEEKEAAGQVAEARAVLKQLEGAARRK